MEREITVRCGGYEEKTESFRFPGGELQVRLPDLKEGEPSVIARLQSSDDVMRLVLLTEMLNHRYPGRFRHLTIPYFPYARQDRITSPNEAFSLKAVCRVVNSLSYDTVTVFDPHSDVTPALLDRVKLVEQSSIVDHFTAAWSCLCGHAGYCIVAPDAGAAKKAQKVRQLFQERCRYRPDFATASKQRDTHTGEISGTEVHLSSDSQARSFEGASCLIVDDICDGGKTFIELGKALKQLGAARVYLYVTHGIFSKGLDVFKEILDGIYTTDTFETEFTNAPYKAPFEFRVTRIVGGL